MMVASDKVPWVIMTVASARPAIDGIEQLTARFTLLRHELKFMMVRSIRSAIQDNRQTGAWRDFVQGYFHGTVHQVPMLHRRRIRSIGLHGDRAVGLPALG